LDRRDVLPERVTGNARWHFIGHLQTNKARKAVGNFALIHSVDSHRLAREISMEAVKKNVVQAILIQVKILRDDTKSGFTPDEIRKELPTILNLPNLEIKGLMAITPLTDDQSLWKECFDGLRQLRDDLERQFSIELSELSMGMSADWECAI